MKAKVVNLQTLFHQRVSYRIPQFQRAYAWGKERQWEPLWNDVRNVANRNLDQEVGTIRPHFLGAIVLQQGKSRTGEVTKRLVIDGQQRLTTLQLLIKATEQAYQNQDDNPRVKRLQGLTTNQKSHWGKEPDNQTKIRQSNSHDQTAFQDAIRDQYSDAQRQVSAISEAYSYFLEEVTTWLDKHPDNRIKRADALEETLTKYLEIAVIDLDEDEKPHIIFETLNARGEPLTQSDLIKNTVMYKANVVDNAQKAKELWGYFDADEWWRRNSHDKLKRIHIDRFFNYWVVIQTLKDVNTNQVAFEFRNYIQKRNRIEKRNDDKDEESTIKTIAKEVREAGKIYKHLEQGKLSEIEVFLKRMKVIEFSALTPLLLWLYISDVPEQQRKRSIEVLESYVVRRMLYGLTTQGLYKFFINLLEKLNKNDSAHTDGTIIRYLKSQTASYVWPSDLMLRKHLIVRPIKGAARRKMVLEAIEMSLRSDKSEPLGVTKKLTVEHVMPQNWEANWPLPISTGASSEDKIENRNQAVETVGNLTLITGKLNLNLSNDKWIHKRNKLYDYSSLFLNKKLLHDAPDVWDEVAIERRSLFLVEKMLQIWPSADSFMQSAA